MNDSTLTRGTMVARSLRFYRWIMILVAAGAAATTSVIVGALLVGDSVRGSMMHLVLDRLGKVDTLILAPRFFEASAVDRMKNFERYPKEFAPPQPAILFPRGTAEFLHEEKVHRAGSIFILGVRDSFWSLGEIRPIASPQGRQVILNQQLAEELHARIGDVVTLRLPSQQAVPADSPLGKRDDLSQSMPQLKVVDIVPNQSLGRFDLRASQKPPRNAYVPIELIQETLERDGQINAILIPRQVELKSFRGRNQKAIDIQSELLLEGMQPSLKDLGLKIERIQKKFPESSGARQSKGTTPAELNPTQSRTTEREETDSDTKGDAIFDYYHITSDQLLIPPTLVQAIERALPSGKYQSVLTYLGNAIEKVGSTKETSERTSTSGEEQKPIVTYSTISAIDPGPTFSLTDVSLGASMKGLKKGEVAVNSWLAERLSLEVGDRIRIAYYLPETAHGKEIEKDWDATVALVVPITKPATPFRRNRTATFLQAPTRFNDPSLTPEVPGITDQDSISDWDVPFPLVRTVPPEDDAYWNHYRLTPKLFLSLEEGQELFGSRFGNVSSIRIDPSIANDAAQLEAMILPELRKVAGQFGLQPNPIHWQQVQASRGTTPFDALFFSLSFFVIVAALLLVSLLFRLGIEQRASQWGLLKALGWPALHVRSLLLREGWMIATLGGAVGVVIGIGYAYLMIWGLSGWWVGAIQTAFLEFYATPLSLLLGWLLGCIASLMSIRWTLASLNRLPALRLLRDRIDESVRFNPRGSRILSLGIVVLGVSAIGILSAGWSLSGEARAGAFVGGSMLLVIASVLSFYRYLRGSNQLANQGGTSSPLSLLGLAGQSARRNPLRSTLSVGMIAFASFLVLSISLFQAKPTESAVGGFDWMAESSLPIAKGLSDTEYQREVLGPKQSALEKATVISMRLRPGDDASCNNLFQANQPRVLGVRPDLAIRDGQAPKQRRFPWAAHEIPEKEEETRSVFHFLERPAEGTIDNPIPVVIDLNTAMWSLHRGAAVGEVFSFRYDDRDVHFKTVGLLQNSLLQGYLIIGESNFVRVFPEISGYQTFLIDSWESADPSGVVSALETGWGDDGLDVTPSASILQQLLAVQNTYLSAFQVLGTLGLLLGTFGLAVVQARSIAERKSELALLQAIGFSHSRITTLLMTENVWLLVLGIGIGGLSALVAVVPSLIGGQAMADFSWPSQMLLLVVISGIASGYLAISRSRSLPILASLRGK